MRWPLAVFLCSPLLLPAVGCRNSDLVEAELRTRERELREAKDELYRTELFNGALQRELHTVRPGGLPGPSPELASQTYTLKEIVLGRQTGGYDPDGKPGDVALQVVLEPRDPDGHSIKAPGALHVDALQISPEGLKTPLSSWDVPPEQLRRTWRSGLFATGYYVVLPWKVWPTSTRLRVIARFTLADGRAFESDKDVTVRLAPEAPRRQGPVLVPDEMPLPPAVPEREPLLPPPRPVEPGTPDNRTPAPGEIIIESSRTSSWKRDVAPASVEPVRLLAPVAGR